MMNEVPLQCENLTCGYTLPILSDLQFSIPEGEAVGVIGEGGVGKSLLLKTIAGLLSPISGQIQVEGMDCAMTFQRGGLLDKMTCGENLELYLKAHLKLKGIERRQRVENMLQAVGLSKVGAMPVSALSGGMQKRLGIARALLQEPQLLLMDEPTAGLDPVTARSIVDLILEHWKRLQFTLVLASGDLGIIQAIATRVLFLDQGKLAFDGVLESFKNTSNSRVVRFLRGVQ